MIFCDGAAEHGTKGGTHKLIESIPGYVELLAAVRADNPDRSIELIKIPPNSPQLNLCEFYNRQLRSIATDLRTDPSISAQMLEAQPRGQNISHRVNLLERILIAGMALMKSRGPHQHSYRKLNMFINDVISEDGFLDARRPM